MTFNSVQYAALLLVVLLIYWRLHRRNQNILLLLTSYFFYGLWNWRFCGLLALSTATDYTVGRLIESTSTESRRRLFFFASLAVNLGVLGFFKYFNFFADSAYDLLNLINIQIPRSTLNVLLPIGISFYTFHGISYTFDVYRRHIHATKDPLSFAVFVAFFPQLVAGPIGRAHLQLPQFERDRTFPRGEELRGALFLIALGLFRKVVIADAVAPIANQAFSSPDTRGWLGLLVGVYAFALQIYGDFAGYSDIARGSARLLGIDLPVNFNQPYLSRSITEFWRRWHISLSNWLRDYVYVPFGGNRGSKPSTYRNLLATMLIGGLWHGASMTFVAWGGLQGLLLVAEREVLPPASTDANRPFKWRSDIIRVLVTFHIVCFAWVFFRADSIREALVYLSRILTLRGGSLNKPALMLLLPVAIVSFTIDYVQRRHSDHVAIIHWGSLSRGAVYAALFLGIVVFSGGAPVPFIYFRF